MDLRFKPCNTLQDKIMEAVLQSCTGKEREVMEYRLGYGLDKGLSLEKTGELLGHSMQYIGQIENTVIMKIALMSTVHMKCEGQSLMSVKFHAIKKMYDEWYGRDHGRGKHGGQIATGTEGSRADGGDSAGVQG